jgi:hypothetical protein
MTIVVRIEVTMKGDGTVAPGKVAWRTRQDPEIKRNMLFNEDSIRLDKEGGSGGTPDAPGPKQETKMLGTNHVQRKVPERSL